MATSPNSNTSQSSEAEKKSAPKSKEMLFIGSFSGAAVCMTMIGFTALHDANQSMGAVTNWVQSDVHRTFIVTNCLFLLVSLAAFLMGDDEKAPVYKLAVYSFCAAMVLMIISSVIAFLYFNGG